MIRMLKITCCMVKILIWTIPTRKLVVTVEFAKRHSVIEARTVETVLIAQLQELGIVLFTVLMWIIVLFATDINHVGTVWVRAILL